MGFGWTTRALRNASIRGSSTERLTRETISGRSPCLKGPISSWAITAIKVSTADSGASYGKKRFVVRPSGSTGHGVGREGGRSGCDGNDSARPFNKQGRGPDHVWSGFS